MSLNSYHFQNTCIHTSCKRNMPCSYMHSPWTLTSIFSEFKRKSEILGIYVAGIPTIFRSWDKFKRTCITCRWQHLITLSRRESHSVGFYAWQWWHWGCNQKPHLQCRRTKIQKLSKFIHYQKNMHFNYDLILNYCISEQ